VINMRNQNRKYTQEEFEKALQIGRPPTITKLFPNSKALLVSGKVINKALVDKGCAMTIAANARNNCVIKGALKAAQKANSVLIIEIAKSEGGQNAYCATSFWNIARQIDSACNELKITIPVAVHADHYGIKNAADIEVAKTEIPSLFEAGITSIAIDASHMNDADNLLASIELNKYVPKWAGLETEVGEIKGKDGLSTKEEALFLVQGLNANGIFPDWIALNNGTTHGIEASDQGIQVELTAEIHEALVNYRLSGAQHGTSGNSSERLRKIVAQTRTTKANVATALQMVSWGLEVNDYGNAILDGDEFIKVEGAGVTEELWKEMKAYAAEKGLKKGNYKKLSLPFENKIMSQPIDIRERMVKRVEDFIYHMLTDVFNAKDSANVAIQNLLDADNISTKAVVGQIENPAEWTSEKIKEKAKFINSDKGPEGDFDD